MLCNTNIPIMANAASGSLVVYTPNGTSVPVVQRDEMNEIMFNNLMTECTTESPYKDAVLLGNPTTAYNCHSYAWYSQNTSTNTYWMNDPTQYYTDYSYCEVSTPRAGDIICYFDDKGTTSTADDVNLHSGIVTSVNDSLVNDVCGMASLVNVTSKWGRHGLFSHRGDICPYVATYSGGADYVKFYRPRTNAVYSLSKTMDTLSISRAINGSGSIVDKYGMYELNVTQTGLYTIRVNATKALNNGLYTANMNLVQIGWSTSGAGNYTYTMRMPAGTFYLRTEYTDATDSGTISIHIEPHTHRYDCWTYKDHSTHVECCSCGLKGTATGVHSIRSSDAVNGKAPCLVCGYVLDLRFDAAEVPFQRVAQVSVNGSYILDNGIVVLVDEDVEAYLSGNLVFYNRDSVPSTQ